MNCIQIELAYNMKLNCAITTEGNPCETSLFFDSFQRCYPH